MRIAMLKVRTAFCLLTLAVSSGVCAQDILNTKPFERYWTQPRLVPKAGGGILRDRWFVEAGIQWHKIYVHPLSLASAGPYITVDALVRNGDWITGPKAGYELTAGLLGIAADMTLFTDFERESVVLTPKAGLSIMGFVNLFYGRNIPISDFQFDSIDKNRFSLVFNINRDYFNLRDAPKKR